MRISLLSFGSNSDYTREGLLIKICGAKEDGTVWTMRGGAGMGLP